jgi:hypothetical protein
VSGTPIWDSVVRDLDRPPAPSSRLAGAGWWALAAVVLLVLGVPLLVLLLA